MEYHLLVTRLIVDSIGHDITSEIMRGILKVDKSSAAHDSTQVQLSELGAPKTLNRTGRTAASDSADCPTLTGLVPAECSKSTCETQSLIKSFYVDMVA